MPSYDGRNLAASDARNKRVRNGVAARDLLADAIDRTGGHLADPWTLTETGRESQFPCAFPELEREQQIHSFSPIPPTPRRDRIS